jgi:type I restriction enzyme, S subunit
MTWQEYTLDQLGCVSRGKSKHRPRDAVHLYNGPYPFIQTGDVKHAGLYLNEYTQTYSEDGLAQSKLWPVGTLCITIAANIADTSILGIEACFPDSVIGFIPDEKKTDARFIKYLFDAKLKLQYRQFTQGAAQDNLSQKKLLSKKLLIPPLIDQKEIADFISKYDDFIENNQRRIQLLEESAQLLYKEWFIYFRFPGHEHVKIINNVPDGWKKTEIGKVTDIKKGKNITKETALDGEIPVVAGGLKPAYYHKEYNVKGPVITVSASGANAGYVNIYNMNIWASDCSYINYEIDKNIFFRYNQLKYFQDAIFGMQHGAAQPHVYPKDIARLEVLEPTEKIKKEYNRYVEKQYEFIKILNKKNIQLAKARDLLLPRLMNGDIAV